MAVGDATRVGKTRKFCKMLLPRRQIRANGRSLDLGSYFTPLIQAEREGAFDQIALQVHETHTKDPRHTEGKVANLRHLADGPDGDGLYGDIEFADESGVELVRKSFGKVGVSVSMVENLVREEDGKRSSWPIAMQHVLMTTDPHVRSMGGWHPIELSRSTVEMTIDLSGSTYDELEEPMTAPTAPPEGQTADAGAPTEGDELVEMKVTPEQRDALLGLLSDIDTAQAVAGRGSGDEGAPAEGGRPVLAGAGAPTNLDRESAEGEDDPEPSEIELMRAEIDVERQRGIELQRELHAARAASEIREIESTGLAPSIIDLARPLLELERGSGTIELSRDARGRVQTVDPTQIIRQVLHQVIELERQGLSVIDLDREIGMHEGSEPEVAQRNQALDYLDKTYGSD